MDNYSNDMTGNDRQQLILNFLAGRASVEEERELQEWIRKDPENSALFAFHRDI